MCRKTGKSEKRENEKRKQIIQLKKKNKRQIRKKATQKPENIQ